MAEKKRVDNKGRKLPDGFSQRPDGRYMARFTYNGERYTLYDLNLGALKEKVNTKKYELKNNAVCKDSNITINGWYEQWLHTYYIKKVKITTLTKRDEMYRRYVYPDFGKKKLQRVKQLDIVNFYNSLTDNLCSDSIKILHHLLNSMYKSAISNDLVVNNPCTGALEGVEKTKKKERRVLTKEEQEIFFDYISTNGYWIPYKPLFTVMFGTGMRIGEITGLIWDDVDFENNTIHVRRNLDLRKTYGDNKTRFHIGTPKTQKSIRDIPMLPEVRTALLNQRQAQDMRLSEKAKNYTVDGVKGFVFTTQHGSPREEHNINHSCKRIVAGINKRERAKAEKEKRKPVIFDDFTPHCIRHTFATRAFESGMKPKVVQEILGHSSLAMTMDLYTHVTSDTAIDEMNLMKKVKIS